MCLQYYDNVAVIMVQKREDIPEIVNLISLLNYTT